MIHKVNEGGLDLNGVDYLFVGKQPIIKEVRENSFKVSKGYKLLDLVLKGLEIENYEMTKLALCRPSNNKEHSKESLEHCFSRLKQQIKESNIKAIIPLGKAAIEFFMDNPNNKSIGKLRGRAEYYSELGCYIVPTYHPIYVYNKPGNYRRFVRDIEKLKNLDKLPRGLEDIRPQFKVIDNLNQVTKAIDFLRQQDMLSCDIETSGFNFRKDKIGVLGFAYHPRKAIIFSEKMLENKFVRQQLKSLFMDKSIIFLWQNGKFDVRFLNYQWDLGARIDEDTMLMHYVLDEKSKHGLTILCREFLNVEDYEDKFKKLIPKGGTYLDAPRHELHKYLACDVGFPLRLYRLFKNRMDKDDKKAYYNLLIPAANELINLEVNGTQVDVAHLKQLKVRYSVKVKNLLKQLRQAAQSAGYDTKKYQVAKGANDEPEAYNPSSWKQNRYLFFDLLGLKKYENSLTTNAKALQYWLEKRLDCPVLFDDISITTDFKDKQQEQLEQWLDEKPAHRVVFYMVKYRKASKLYDTYIKGTLNELTEYNRVHTSFLVHGTATGRLSSRGPNIQNVSKAKDIKDIFTSKEGYTLMEIDYSLVA